MGQKVCSVCSEVGHNARRHAKEQRRSAVVAAVAQRADAVLQTGGQAKVLVYDTDARTWSTLVFPTYGEALNEARGLRKAGYCATIERL